MVTVLQTQYRTVDPDRCVFAWCHVVLTWAQYQDVPHAHVSLFIDGQRVMLQQTTGAVQVVANLEPFV